jgi:sulfur transfer complex TusBCD TusB component (DsrH family)
MAVYNTLRWKIDGLVYQISGDIIAANSPRKFIKLDKWCLKETSELEPSPTLKNASYPTNIKIYILALEEIESFYQNNVLASLQSNTRLKTLNLTTNVFYLLKDSYTIIKGISDMKTQKTMAIVELLDHTRLLSPEELGKKK